MCSKSGESHKSKCGSELAREGAVSDNVDLNDPPQSRAGSLPQGYCGVLKIQRATQIQMWERACSRRRSVRQC
ncbi:hypothetical protein E1508_00145 [Pseudomonas moraviensis]|nr:hypothetical protein E1508_00145 [Pseudomonas moraviensis]